MRSEHSIVYGTEKNWIILMELATVTLLFVFAASYQLLNLEWIGTLLALTAFLFGIRYGIGYSLVTITGGIGLHLFYATQAGSNPLILLLEPGFFRFALTIFVIGLLSGAFRTSLNKRYQNLSWNTERIESLQPQDFFIKNEEHVHFEEWDSYLMDMTSSHYRSVLMNDIQTQVVDKGFDGVFFDTVSDMEDQFHGKDPQQYNAQKNAFITLQNQLDRQYENLFKIQNWGIELFRADTVQYMDALMWEGFEYKSMTKDEWSQNQIKGLQQLQKKHNFKVLTVSFEQHAKSKKYAEKQGFLYYAEHKNFNLW